MRPKPLFRLLNSVNIQTLYPDQILIIDGSRDDETSQILHQSNFKNLEYFKVSDYDRGLTKQRNFGISKLFPLSEVVCFLDDDIVLTSTYFENLIDTYQDYPNSIGVGGYIINEVEWYKKDQAEVELDEFAYDGYVRHLGSRHLLRKKLGLQPDVPPCHMPKFSNGYAIGFLPPSGKKYRVENFMGGVSSFRKKIFEKIKFSNYFHGYGLYEDMDFCIRASKLGQLYVNTSAKLYHYHEDSGRPNDYKYGKMVIRNGWYVWRVRYPSPDLISTLKWYSIAVLLTLIRFSNALFTSSKKKAFTESMGRVVGLCSLLIRKPIE